MVKKAGTPKPAFTVVAAPLLYAIEQVSRDSHFHYSSP
jgi:hypothetical protein